VTPGSVEITVDGSHLATAPLDGSGNYSYGTTIILPGIHSVVAHYPTQLDGSAKHLHFQR